MMLIRLCDIYTGESKGKVLKRQNRQPAHHEGEQGNSSIALHIINTSFMPRPLQPHWNKPTQAPIYYKARKAQLSVCRELLKK
jgi:hypothetical protein